MNCAPVEVVGTPGSTFTGPAMYEANVFGGTNCITPENFDVVYPNPGQYVHYGGKYVGGNTGPPTVLTPCPFNEAVNITMKGDGTSSQSSASPATNTTEPASDPVSSEAAPSVLTTMSTSAAAAPDPTTVAADPMTTTPGAGAANIGVSASMTLTSTTVITTTGTVVVTMSGFATVTTAVNDPTTPTATAAIVAPAPARASNSTDSGEAGAACSPDGSIVCASDGQHWFMCDNGLLTDMGSVASGTTCSDGQITRKRGLPPQLWRRSGFKRWV